MANRLQTGLARLTDRLIAHASLKVNYKRVAQSVVVDAVLGSELLKTSDRQGNAKVERTDRDVKIKSSALQLGGSRTTPARDDVIEISFDAEGKAIDYSAAAPTIKRFKVLPLAPDQAPWRYADQFETMLRIHGKLDG